MQAIQSNMAGTIYKILVKPGQLIHAGEDVAILESMKMEVPITAEVSGTVMRIVVEEGAFINEGDTVMELEP